MMSFYRYWSLRWWTGIIFLVGIFCLINFSPSSIYAACSASPFLDERHKFEAQTIDLDNDDIYYTFDWNDGTKEDTPFVPSDTAQTASHSWSAAQDYLVTAVARDTLNGEPSPTSDPLLVCAGKQGDVNHNGVVDVADAMKCVQVILGNNIDPDEVDRCDVNRDSNGNRNVADVMKIVNIILTQP
jgi:hypothetical protein